MRENRSIPRCTVIPEIGYPDLREAARWLCEAFGFTVRVRIADHRVQLNVGDGAVVLIEGAAQEPKAAPMFSVMVRVENLDAHYAKARSQGARILREPTDYPYGERQYTAEDPFGVRWTFSQSIADVAPEEWGGESVELR